MISLLKLYMKTKSVSTFHVSQATTSQGLHSALPRDEQELDDLSPKQSWANKHDKVSEKHFSDSAASPRRKICTWCDRSTSFFLMMFLLFFHSIKAEMDIASSDCIIVIVICFRSLLGKWVQNNINSPLPQKASHFLLLQHLKRHLSCCSLNIFGLWQKKVLLILLTKKKKKCFENTAIWRVLIWMHFPNKLSILPFLICRNNWNLCNKCM